MHNLSPFLADLPFSDFSEFFTVSLVLLFSLPRFSSRQGDQIERIFAQRAIVCFGQFLKK
jgi:hypothetical protein